MSMLFTLLVVVTPPLLLLLCIQSLFSHTLKPKEIWFTFGFSVLGTLLVLIIIGFALGVVFFKYDIPNSLPYDIISSPLLYGVVLALFVDSIPDETFKMLLITKLCMRKKPFTKLMNGMVYGVVASLGFAMVENIIGIRNESILGEFIDGVLGTLFHGTMGAIMGYHLVKSRVNSSVRFKQMTIAWLLPVGLHALYNFPINLKDGIYQSGSKLWFPMYVSLQVASLGVLWIAFRLLKRYLYYAREEQKEEDLCQ